MKDDSNYEKEVLSVIEKMKSDDNAPKNINYFISLLEKHHLEMKVEDNNSVFLFGTSIPEEIVRSFGLKPIWLLGGSHQVGSYAEDTFPRDVDPVVRSSYGLFKYITSNISGSYNVVIPYHNDSFRKLSWMMRLDGDNVISLDIPSVKNMGCSKEIFHRNIRRFVKMMEDRYGKVLKPYEIYETSKAISNAKNQIKRLLELYERNSAFLSATLVYGIISAYYSSDDLNEYSRQLDIVISFFESKSRDCKIDKPKILILGSPIFFPNNKLLEMSESLGSEVSLYSNELTMFMEACELYDENTKEGMIRKIASHYYTLNTMPLNVEEKFESKKAEGGKGVIFHLLKGEVGYDYDLIKVESYFKNKDIPVLRVETDYSPEDKEQLKIRVEAFIEMIKQYS